MLLWFIFPFLWKLKWSVYDSFFSIWFIIVGLIKMARKASTYWNLISLLQKMCFKKENELKSWGLEVSPFATISFKIYDSLFLSLNFLLPSQMLPLHSTLVCSCSYVCLVGFSCHKWHTLFLTLLNLKSWGLEVSTSATLTFKMPYKTKVRTPHNAIKLCYL